MATLIIYKSPHGKRRSCCARCYNAKGPVCQCICEGGNHGVGLRQATENTLRAAVELDRHGMVLGMAVNQMLMEV